jgi:hypothetical protein
MQFFTDIEKSILKTHMEAQRSQIAKAILSKREMLEISLSLTSNYTTEP